MDLGGAQENPYVIGGDDCRKGGGLDGVILTTQTHDALYNDAAISKLKTATEAMKDIALKVIDC